MLKIKVTMKMLAWGEHEILDYVFFRGVKVT